METPPVVPARVLVVEDEDEVRQLEVRLLQRLGHRTEEAANAWQALRLLQQPFDLVLLDLRMPYSIDGGQLIQTLADLDKRVPVIVFTGFAGDLDGELPPFVKAVLEKPIGIERFMQAVTSVLQGPGQGP